ATATYLLFAMLDRGGEVGTTMARAIRQLPWWAGAIGGIAVADAVVIICDFKTPLSRFSL
ncbi:MAG: hypothetical protein KDA51_02295, partial [Planctomycetales bacterium]|nr:hypothetical protein [Planctomycetales bacterium]